MSANKICIHSKTFVAHVLPDQERRDKLELAIVRYGKDRQSLSFPANEIDSLIRALNKWKNQKPFRGELELKAFLLAHREVDADTDCWIWTGQWHKSGFGLVNVSPRRSVVVHKVAAQLWLNAGPHHFVVHSLACCPRVCFNPSHLLICKTRSEAICHVRRLHPYGYGVDAPNANLSEPIIQAIRELRSWDVPVKKVIVDIQKRFNVTVSEWQVGRVANRKAYKNVI